MSPKTRIQEFTKECTVQVLPDAVVGGKRILGGSGFFVAPGVIITCAHVVSSGEHTVGRVQVRWNGETYQGTAEARPRLKGGAAVWDPPDLCVITLDETPPGQPSVVLGELGGANRHELYIAGYNGIYDPNNVRFQSKMGTLGGSQELATETVREIADVEIAPGMSGGPVLDMRRGFVCGVTKAHRMPNDNLGGLFIPAEFIQQEFRDEAWLPNQRASAINSGWREQRDAVLDAVSPAEFRLTKEERDHLATTAAELALETGDFTRAWGDIVELPPQRAFLTLNDLIADLADRTRNGLDPITKLFIWLACHDGTATRDANTLLEYARTRTPHQRLLRLQYETRLLEQKSAPRDPVLLVRLRPYPPSATRTFVFDIWRYANRGTGGGEKPRAVPVVTDGGPYRLPQARKVITGTLKEQVKLVGDRPVIEFALPDVLLDHAVEEWDIGNAIPLGEKYPIVVRLADREIDGTSYVEALQDRAAQFRGGSVPPQGTWEWDYLWLTCQSQYTPRELNRVLGRNPRLPMVAMTAWHGRGRAIKAIKAVKEAGVAVIVWRHAKCAGDACAVGVAGRACPGMRFKQQAADHVAGQQLAALPDQIFKARSGQPSNGALGYQSPGIALIWDDPDLLPWAAGTPKQYPNQPAGWEDVEQLADLPGTGQPARWHPPAASAAGMAGVRSHRVPGAPSEPRAQVDFQRRGSRKVLPGGPGAAYPRERGDVPAAPAAGDR
jgi:NTP-dependent ternary conflict system VMAP-like protein/trypsin-like peptidase